MYLVSFFLSSTQCILTIIIGLKMSWLILQIKCYMKQLLSGIEHCHSRGVMHRDIKGANLLVNNDGILKVADFGLANFCNLGRKQPLTSRVVTLWYRPPELLLGSTEYGASVDLWSVGCVFGELLTGKPILQGRTEVPPSMIRSLSILKWSKSSILLNKLAVDIKTILCSNYLFS